MNNKLILIILSLLFILTCSFTAFSNNDGYTEHLIVNFYKEDPIRSLVNFPLFFDENHLYVWNPDILQIYRTYESNGLCQLEQFSHDGFVVGHYKEAFIREVYLEKIISYVILDKELSINDILEGIIIRNKEGGFAANVEEYDYTKHTFIARIWLSKNDDECWNVARKEDNSLTLVYLPTN